MTIKIGLLGLGTVGRAVAQIILNPQERHPLLQEVEIAGIGVRSLQKSRPVAPDLVLTTDLNSIVTDPQITVIVEVMGGIEPARSLILQGIGAGKHIVTANKALLARHGEEIFEAAKQSQVYVMLEASVCGGIPIISALKQFLGSNRITKVMGIINGTTNYILSRMQEEGGNFADILTDAQRLGYAESDPTTDVDGFDATDKIAILASLAFGERIPLSEVHREGIRQISRTDIACASQLGYVIKLLGRAQRLPIGLEVAVHPMLVPVQHPLASISGVTNAVTVAGDPIGEVVFSGPGAGGGATASAVVADLINILATIEGGGQSVHRLMGCSHHSSAHLVPLSASHSKFYVRFVTLDQPGVIGELGTAFGKYQVSLETVLQKNRSAQLAEVVVITHEVLEEYFWSAIGVIKQLPTLQEVAAVVRVL